MRRITECLFLTLLFLSPINAAQAEIEDKFLRSIFGYLAEARDMNLVAYSGEKVAEIGRMYYLEDPDSIKRLALWTKRGKGLKLFEYQTGFDMSQEIDIQQEESYQIQSKYSDYLAGALKAELKEKGIKASVFKKAVRDAQIKFKVFRKVVPGKVVSDLVNKDKQKIIREYIEFGLGEGLVIPFQQLIIADFSYNEASSFELGALLGVELLESLKAELSANVVTSQKTKTELPASATIAFKPYPVYFKDTDIFVIWP
ncbi:hypothetical protein Sden_1577 [Shewanella denitrificans OS217]|uniref:Uncharacterized protein n=1 Tax=Shewanella denitrificans (strain OS217 / ATCC BAA-1090 / DSM 15013) TaxID=318161 RepID=Q12NW4_SHEDO|nr:hypothetical protein [Shewanella denitrificans]ABE54862.1 hypothetical protein Sden_1577 [Shewanella denitrificans OS217]